MTSRHTHGCAHAATIEFHRVLQRSLAPEDHEDMADAQRRFIGTVPHAAVPRPNGRAVQGLAIYGAALGHFISSLRFWARQSRR